MRTALSCNVTPYTAQPHPDALLPASFLSFRGVADYSRMAVWRLMCTFMHVSRRELMRHPHLISNGGKQPVSSLPKPAARLQFDVRLHTSRWSDN